MIGSITSDTQRVSSDYKVVSVVGVSSVRKEPVRRPKEGVLVTLDTGRVVTIGGQVVNGCSYTREGDLRSTACPPRWKGPFGTEVVGQTRGEVGGVCDT